MVEERGVGLPQALTQRGGPLPGDFAPADVRELHAGCLQAPHLALEESEAGGAAYATVGGVGGTGGAALYVAIGVLVLAISVLLIWAGRLLGRLSRPARLGILAFEYASIVLGLLSYADPLQAALRIVLAVVAIYYLQFDSRTRALFAPPTA